MVEPPKWQHAKAYGILDVYGDKVKAEVHWLQEKTVGKYKFRVKRWLEWKNIFVDTQSLNIFVKKTELEILNVLLFLTEEEQISVLEQEGAPKDIIAFLRS